MRMDNVGWRGGRMRKEDVWEEGMGKEIGAGMKRE